MMSDIGAATTGEIIDDLRMVAKAEKLEPDDVKSVLRLRLIEALTAKDRSMQLKKEASAGNGKVLSGGRKGKREGGREGRLSWMNRGAKQGPAAENRTEGYKILV